MNFYERFKITIHISILAITLIFCAVILHFSIKNRGKAANVISVIGMATKDFSSDLIVWQGSFLRKNMNLKTAYEELDKDKEILRKYLISKNVNEKDIVFSAVDIAKDFEQKYDRNGLVDNVFTGFRLTQRVSIESKEVEKIEEISRRVTELINSGVEFYSEIPQYYYTKLADLKLELIAMASDDAHKRAESIASKSMAKLGKLRAANADAFQITARYVSETFTYGGLYNTSARNKTVTITIRIQYEIE